MRSHPAALTLPGGKLPRFATQQSETPLRGQLRQRGAAGSVRSARLRCGTGALPARCRGARSAQRPPSHFLPPRGLPGTVPPSSSGAASAADTQPSTMNFCIAVLLVLHSLPGKVELEDDLEEMAQDLYDYMAHLSNYYDSTYSTEDYYYDNITATPATYVYDLESYETSTFGDIDWEKWFSEENDTTTTSGLPNTNSSGDARDAKDTQVGACQLRSSAAGF
ncbi:uncharacterized protein LOC117008779 isoform X1 [Catharus ustulatus]|uniref:uncharacterized protein LOC117008779 isoform X1 n=1 Tax=Catharus ustulatus TaxID=91951 RepID=UPI00140D6B49|nr:uncharacterized protein LOC117008779 isoform X1 [Catharus ustulatus]